jgi:hypothetical protein
MSLGTITLWHSVTGIAAMCEQRSFLDQPGAKARHLNATVIGARSVGTRSRAYFMQ